MADVVCWKTTRAAMENIWENVLAVWCGRLGMGKKKREKHTYASIAASRFQPLDFRN